MKDDTQFQINFDVTVPGAKFVAVASDKVSELLQSMMAEQEEEGNIYDSEA